MDIKDNDAAPPDLDGIRDRAREIVAGGSDVRARIAALVADAARQAQASGQGLLNLVKSVMDGASAAAATAIDSQPGGVLKQVTDALGDGLSQTAVSAKLAMDEARARGQRFAGEDLHALGANLAALKDLFAQTVVQAGRAVHTEVSGQAGDLKEHAERVIERVRPSLDATIQAVKDDPVKLGKESLSAGAEFTRQAAGGLFTAMGGLLQKAGESLKGQTRV